jgi:general secretion pathway protein A
MYEAHFGLAELPFPTGQDPRYYVDTPPHRAAVLALLAGFERGDAFMLLTGEFGVGKTTIARRVLAQADSQRHRVVELTSLRIEGDELFDRIAEALGAPSVDAGQGQRALSRLLEDLAAAGQDALVLVDEAQRLDVDSLARLRELTTAPIDKRGKLHLCLIGRTAPPGIEALRRMGRPLDLGTTVNIGPLDAAGTRDYVLARLNRVGWMGRPSFDEGAFAAIHGLTGGIPGRINRLCRHILLQRYMMHRDDVDAASVRAVDDLLKSEFGVRPPTPDPPPFVATLPGREPRALAAAQDLPERRSPGGVPATLPGLGARAPNRWRPRWIHGAGLAVVLSSSGIGWYAMSGHGVARTDAARIAAAWPMATRPATSRAMPVAAAPVPRPALAALAAASLPAAATTAVALESAAPQTIAQSPPGAGPAGIARPLAPAAVPGATGTPERARTAPTGATFAPQRLHGEAAEERLRTHRERAPDLRPARSTTTPAACTLEGESLGLCGAPRVPGPKDDAARKPAVDSSRRTPPAGPLRPPCAPTQAALGLCPER